MIVLELIFGLLGFHTLFLLFCFSVGVLGILLAISQEMSNCKAIFAKGLYILVLDSDEKFMFPSFNHERVQ